MKNFRDLWEDYWRYAVVGVLIAILGYFLIFRGITHLVPAYSTGEIAAQGNSTSLRAILENPLNAPYKLLLWLPFKLGHHSVLFTRLAAGSIAFVTAGLFYLVVYRLYSHRIAIISTLLFVTSSGFLHAAHVGTALILQIFGVMLLLSLFHMYILAKGKVLPHYLAAIIVAGLLYIPGMLWFIIVGAIALNKRLYQLVAQLHLKHRIAIAAMMLVLITPLLWAIVVDPTILVVGLGLQETWPHLSDIATRARDLTLSLFWSGKGPAEIMLVGAPILTVVELGLLFVGIAVQFKPPRLRNNLFMIAALLFLVLLIIFGGVINYITLTPIIYLLIAGGLFYLLTEWHKVFPLNPVAHTIGNVVIFILIVSSMFFHVRAFFVAWPHSSYTHAAFSSEQPTTYFITKTDQKTKPDVLPNIGF